MKPRISVVVPSYRRPALLQRCLAALQRQDLPRTDFEIIIVHDGPGPAARELIADWNRRFAAQGPPLRLLEPPHGGPAAARNAGWRAAAADVIAFTDDDTVPDPAWLRTGLQAFTEDVDAAWGAVHVPLPADPTDYEVDSARLGAGQFVTANCFCTRRILEAIGGFDSRFKLAWREDSDLFFQMMQAGARIVHVPAARVVHPIRPAPWGVSLRQQKKVLYDALLFSKHRALYRKCIRSRPRWDYYLIVLALIGAVLAAVAGAGTAALVCAAVWLVLTARFCMERLRPASKRPGHVAEMAVTSALIPPLALFWRMAGVLRFRVAFL